MSSGTTFSGLVQALFTDRLLRQRGASPHTVAGYRDTFRLLLRFAKERLGKAPSKLSLSDLDAAFVGEFLDHLEKARGNGARSRNTRLAAIHPGVPTVARRPYTGFDLEVTTYTRLKPELLSRFPGKFMVIVADEVEGPFETFREALRAGYRRFGLGPLYVKQVLAVEPTVEVTRDVVPCRS